MAWEGGYHPEPCLDHVLEGSEISLGGKAWFYDKERNAYHCTTLLRGQPFLLRGAKLAGERFTIISALVTKESTATIVDATGGSLMIHQLIDSTTATEVIDVCAGYSIMSAGYSGIGCKVRCHVEINTRYADWLRRKHLQVIEGDIDSPTVHKALLPYMTTPCIVTGGFACQPFSKLGDHRQQLDPRARSFEGMIQVGYLFQPVAMVLECTKEAMSSPWAQTTLNAFCKSMGYSLQQQICHLQDFWPAKRSRWWAVVVHPLVRMPPIKSFPKLPFLPAFRHLIPTMARWPQNQMVELSLSPHELEAFAEQPGGLGKNSVCPTKPLQTALHAWGSQLTACACGCRAGGFTHHRLEEKGLFGALVPTSGSTIIRGSETPNMRHIHPDEVAILHMVPIDHIQSDLPRDLRLDLTALGQMASPAQALWHVAQVIQALHNTLGTAIDQKLAEQGLMHLAIETFASRDRMPIPKSLPCFRKQSWHTSALHMKPLSLSGSMSAYRPRSLENPRNGKPRVRTCSTNSKCMTPELPPMEDWTSLPIARSPIAMP